MRTLVVDNYDSFTYNLFHLLAEVNGERPVVIKNDEPAWKMDDLRSFDNVVISPGPGRPDRRGDFGICADIIRDGELPLLGVCLGHQGLCHLHGGEVGPAPEVRHGRLSHVLHRQVDILAGVPSPFSVVRYHSLVATRLGSEVEAIGWTLDGVLMAVRHRHRPAWGVQFHPESICTEHGLRILENFRDLTERWRHRTLGGRPPRPEIRPSRAAGAGSNHVDELPPPPPGRVGVGGQVASSGRPMKVLVQKLRAGASAEVVFASLYGTSRQAFWLDSSKSDAEVGRFSFMGDAAGPLARTVTADAWEGRVTVSSGEGTVATDRPFLEWLDEDLRAHRAEIPELPFEFALGWVGYLGYELKAECGGDRSHRAEHPDAAMIFADRAIAFDHLEGSLYLLALAESGREGPAVAWLRETAVRVACLRTRSPEPVAPPPPLSGGIALRHGREQYLRLISACQEAITAGETYEVCLTNMATGTGWVEAWDCYRFLRRENPAPFGALLRFDDLSVLSSSPERFLRVSRTGVVESRPIKGTRPRSPSPVEDERLRLDLASNEKDRAENLMIVDLVRNDLGRCAEVGSVSVPKIFDVETYATVHQLVSTVRARLDKDSSAVACVRAAFPGGSMTGAPKIRTMQIIDRLENGPRGIYSGALGYLSLSGAADLGMVIRTLVVGPGRLSFGVGGAIVALSDPTTEFEETAVKATAVTRLLGVPFPGLAPDSHALPAS
jgi:para-aminobenzoate synthetase